MLRSSAQLQPADAARRLSTQQRTRATSNAVSGLLYWAVALAARPLR